MSGVRLHPISDDRVAPRSKTDIRQSRPKADIRQSTPLAQMVARPPGWRERFCVYRTVTRFTPLHFHSMAEVALVQQGAGLQQLGNQTFEATEHMLTFVPPNLPHSLTSTQPIHKWVCMFDVGLIESLPTANGGTGASGWMSAFQPTAVKLSRDEAQMVAGLFGDLLAERRSPHRLASGAVTAALIVRIMVHHLRRAERPLVRTAAVDGVNESDQYDRVISFLHRHFTEPVNRATVAKSLGIRPETVSRAFAGQGRTFSEYLTRLRLGHAVDLLQNSSHSTTEIGRRSGFGSYRSFTRAFHQNFGQSPATLRGASARTESPL